MQLEGRNVPCKQCCASGLQRHLIICTEDVNCCTTHVTKSTDLFSGYDCIFLAEQPYNEYQLIDMFYSLLAASICCYRVRPSLLQRSHLFLSPTLYTRSVYEGRFELLRPIRVGDAFVSLLHNYFSEPFVCYNVFRFSRFSDQLFLRKRFLGKKVIQKRVFLTHKIEFVYGRYQKKKGFRSLFF